MRKSLLVSLMLWPSFACQAGDYYLNPVFGVSERFNTNINMINKPPQDNWITTISPGINFGLRSENETLDSNFTWNHLAYTNQSELDFDETLLGVNYQHKKTDRLQWGLVASYNNRSSLNSQDTGTIIGENRRDIRLTQVATEQISVAPSLSYSLDELNTIAFDYAYNQTTYEQAQTLQNSFQADYDYHQMSGTFTHLYSESDQFDVTLSSSRYKTPLQDQTAFNHVAQLGWQHMFSEQLVTYLSAGINYSEIESSIPPDAFFRGIPVWFDPATNRFSRQERFEKNSGIGEVFSASIQKSFESGTVLLGISQNQTPTSQGLQTRTNFAFNANYPIDERWTSGFSANYSMADSTGQNNSQFNRDNFSFSPSLNWKWSPEINLGLSYNFRQQEFEGGQPSQGNQVEFVFSYRPQLNNLVK
jgi:hypothetical protein